MCLHVFIHADDCTLYLPVAGRDGYYYYYFDDGDADVSLRPASALHPASASVSKEPSGVRVEFPETWLWSELSSGYHPMPAVVLILFLLRSACVCR